METDNGVLGDASTTSAANVVRSQLVQPSLGLAFPSSQLSASRFTMPSPQTLALQLGRQASSLNALPSSQASTPTFTAPSPQTLGTQLLRQPSLSMSL